MIGLDFRDPIRAIQLVSLPENRFLVKRCEIYTHLSQIPHTAFPCIIAFPDIQVLSRSTSAKNLFSDAAQDHRGSARRLLHQKNLHTVLQQFKPHAIRLHAADIESEAIARALTMLCDIPEKCFALLYQDCTHLWMSVFREHQKIFFHQENSHDNSDLIIQRALKLFRQQFPQHEIQQHYVIGDTEKIAHWGKIPDITSTLDFDSSVQAQKWQDISPTHWLLACGLSLWEKKSSWNLLPWREQEKQAKRKHLRKHLFAWTASAISVVLLAHGLMWLSLHVEKNRTHRLAENIRILQTKALPSTLAQQEIQQLQTRLESLSGLSVQQSQLIHSLEMLNQRMPDNLFLTSLTYTQSSLLLNGRAQTQVAVQHWRSQLQHQTPPVTSTIHSMTEMDNALPDHVDFNMEIKIA